MIDPASAPTHEIYSFWRQALAAPRCWRLGLCEAFFEAHSARVLQAELAPPGTRLRQGDSFGFLHTASGSEDLRAPHAMEILAVNPLLEGHADLTQTASYGRGWLVEVKEL